MSDVVRLPPPGPVDDPRPWEGPGVVRRDCVPHRGRLLGALALAACLCGLLSLLLAVPGLLGFAVGVIVRRFARRDLAGMRAGLVDPAGEEDTRHARHCAGVGMVLSACGPPLHAAGYLLLRAEVRPSVVLLVLTSGVAASLGLFVTLVFVVLRRPPPSAGNSG